MSQITIKNISTAQVIISVPDINFRRPLSPGREIPITKKEYEDLSFDPGFSTLVRSHYIRVSGLEEQETVEEVSNVVDSTTIAKMLDDLDITAFAKFIPNAAPAEKDTTVQLAIEKGITNSAITALIKKYCDVDIIKAINVQHELNEK